MSTHFTATEYSMRNSKSKNEMIMAVLKGVLYCLLRGRERMWKKRLWGRRSK